MKHQNGQARAAAAWAIVSLGGLLCAFLPLLLGIADAQVTSVLIAVGILLAGGGLAAHVFCGLRAHLLSRLLSGKDVLVQWTYPAPVAELLSEDETSPECRWGCVLIRVGIPLCTAVALLYFFARPDAAGIVVAALLGVVALLAMGAALEPVFRRIQAAHAPREVILSRDGAYVFGKLHAWTPLGGSIVDAGVVPGGVPILRLTYFPWFLTAQRPVTASIPIPPGEEARASDVALILRQTKADAQDLL